MNFSIQYQSRVKRVYWV